jgi:hypothetical protein
MLGGTLAPPYPLYPPGFDGIVNITNNNPNGYNAQSPVPLVPHLHGAEVQSFSDGGPDAWWTYNGIVGPTYSTSGAQSTTAPMVGGFASAVYDYPNAQNQQPGKPLLGMAITMSGLAILTKASACIIVTPLPTEQTDQYMTQPNMGERNSTSNTRPKFLCQR